MSRFTRGVLSLAAAVVVAAATPAIADEKKSEPMAVCHALADALGSGDCPAKAAALQAFLAEHEGRIGLIKHVERDPLCSDRFDDAFRATADCWVYSEFTAAFEALAEAIEAEDKAALDAMPAAERAAHELQRLADNALAFFQEEHVDPADDTGMRVITRVYPASPERQCTSSHADSALWEDLRLSLGELGAVELCYQASADRKRFAASARADEATRVLCVRGDIAAGGPGIGTIEERADADACAP